MDSFRGASMLLWIERPWKPITTIADDGTKPRQTIRFEAGIDFPSSALKTPSDEYMHYYEQEQSPLFQLPGEIRNRIFEHVLLAQVTRRDYKRTSLQVLRICRKAYLETRSTWVAVNEHCIWPAMWWWNWGRNCPRHKLEVHGFYDQLSPRQKEQVIALKIYMIDGWTEYGRPRSVLRNGSIEWEKRSALQELTMVDSYEYEFFPTSYKKLKWLTSFENTPFHRFLKSLPSLRLLRIEIRTTYHCTTSQVLEELETFCANLENDMSMLMDGKFLMVDKSAATETTNNSQRRYGPVELSQTWTWTAKSDQAPDAGGLGVEGLKL